MNVEESVRESAKSLEIERERVFSQRVNRVFALILVGLGCLVVLLFNAPFQFCFLAPVAFGCAVAALVVARRLRVDGLDERLRTLARAQRRWAICFASVLIAGAFVLGVACLGAARGVSLSQVSAHNLRDLGEAIRMYCRDTGTCPTSWVPMIERDLITPKQCICGWDCISEKMVLETGHSSYVLLSAGSASPNDEKLIIAHERLPWSYVGRAVWPERGFAVLFGDGTIRFLTVNEMTQAIAQDRYLRKELGWPEPP